MQTNKQTNKQTRPEPHKAIRYYINYLYIGLPSPSIKQICMLLIQCIYVYSHGSISKHKIFPQTAGDDRILKYIRKCYLCEAKCSEL